MAKIATLNVTLSITGDGVNDQTIPIASWQSTNSPGYRNPAQVLSSGPNTITLPTSPVPLGGYLIITVPSGFTITFKGVAADTGYNAGNAGGTLVLPLNQASPGSFVVNASAQCVATVWVV
ncbi:MAG TPA: hypothetical protein VGG39_23305 [Polyangiaceae bacterium]|jgi:hypothetical protein